MSDETTNTQIIPSVAFVYVGFATMLEATASANNTNAIHMATTRYKEIMDRISGPHCSNYIRPEELKDEHKQALWESLQVFDSIANFGSKTSIEKARTEVVQETATNFEMYDSLNKSRNPLAGLETYVMIRNLCLDSAHASQLFSSPARHTA